MSNRVVITRSIWNNDNSTISMLFEENKETRIEIYKDKAESLIGNIYVGRVRDLVKNIGAAFVEIAPGEVCYFSLKDNPMPLFLNRKNSDRVCQGDLMLVQVAKEPIKTKAALCTSQINLNGRYLILTREQPGKVGISKKIKDSAFIDRVRSTLLMYTSEDFGFVVRTEAYEANWADVLDELEKLLQEYDKLLNNAIHRPAFTLMKKADSELLLDIKSFHLSEEDEIITDDKRIYDELISFKLANPIRLYEDGLLPLYKLYDFEGRIDKALSQKVWLKSGGYLIIEPTEALTVIDVNTGKNDSSQKDSEETFYRTNVEACEEIARQLILRNISGIIIIDLINLSNDSHRKEINRIMNELLIKDSVKTNLVDVTKLGLMELTRKKIKASLAENMLKNN